MIRDLVHPLVSSGITDGILSSRTFPDHVWLEAQASTLGINLVNLSRSRYRLNSMAQSIRDNAGLPTGVTAGVPAGTTTGLTDAGALGSLIATLNLNSLSAVTTAASSGSGTESDPYIIENVEAGRLHLDNDWGATPYVTIRNSRFRDGTSYETQVFTDFVGGEITFENCYFGDIVNTNADTYGFQIGAPCTLKFDKCHLAGWDNQLRVFGVLFASMSASSTVNLEFTDCLIDDSYGTYPTSCDFIDNTTNNSGQLNLTMLRCTVDITLGTGQSFLEVREGDVVTPDIRQCSFEGWRGIIFCEQNSNTSVDNMEFHYNTITDTTDEQLYILGARDCNVSYCEFTQNASYGAQDRVVMFDTNITTTGDWADSHPENVDVHHCKFTKKSGTVDLAVNECLESRGGKNVTFRHCWVTECPEDAFEHIYQNEGCTVEYCVGDNVQGQIVDIYKQTEDNGVPITGNSDLSTAKRVKGYVHNIYGQCNDRGIVIDGIRGVIAHDIEIDNTGGASGQQNIAVRARDNEGSGGTLTEPREVYIGGALTTAADVQAVAGLLFLDSNGADLEARYIDDNGALQTVT